MNKKDTKKRPPVKKGTFLRILKTLFGFYPAVMPAVVLCIIFTAVVSSIPTLFMQKIITALGIYTESGDWASARPEVLKNTLILLSLYIVSLISSLVFSQTMAVVTQGFLYKLRAKMFNSMQSFPVRYFDNHSHGDIMSGYTNDIDTLRQLVSQSFPSLIQASVVVITNLTIMLYFSLWLALVIIAGVALIFFVSKKIGGRSAGYFVRQQKSLGKAEGYIEEMMNGQKVIKVFCRENESKKGFDEINEALFEDAAKANKYANILMPILGNIGNLLYVLVALVGGLLLLYKVPNISLSGFALSVSIVVPFLNLTRQFSGNVNQVSSQINSVVMALAGADRIFSLIDEKPEEDNGYVTLVNAEIDDKGNVKESEKQTGTWAWKHPHSDGSVTYTPLRGDVRLLDVDFAYEEGKPVLNDVSVYAEPGQKVAFVGATGAGKTTITNLINRFYDIADGKIRYDGININKIKKADLRRSLGMVLQDTNLFTGTVMENIRYGKLDASDSDCIDAAMLAGAHDFITRLPEGYNTVLSGNGANLSQGQRQLIAIARCAVANPPVMILDEATSSIDTRTEAIVQKGMDALMHGRTVFVIAHRLSTVKNADVIMVLDHGRIIERGSHEKLIAERGTYYRLYTGAFELE